jgi:hypothetical protein
MIFSSKLNSQNLPPDTETPYPIPKALQIALRDDIALTLLREWDKPFEFCIVFS